MLAIEGVLVLIVTALLLILLVKEKASLDALGVGVLVALVAIGELLRLSDPSFDPALQLIDAAGALSGFGNGAAGSVRVAVGGLPCDGVEYKDSVHDGEPVHFGAYLACMMKLDPKDLWMA